MDDIIQICLRRINTDLDVYEYNKEKFNKMEDIMQNNKKFSIMLLKIVITNGTITGYNTEGDNRKQYIIKLLENMAEYIKTKNKTLPDVVMYIYVSDWFGIIDFGVIFVI